MAETLHTRIGDNIGNILLDIAQTAIQNGDPDKAVRTYTESLHGFTKDYVVKLLKNEYVLVTDPDGVSVNMTDWENERKFNQSSIINWNYWMKIKLDNLIESVKCLNLIRDEFDKHCNGFIFDTDITKCVVEHFGDEYSKNIGIHNIAAKLIAGDGFANCWGNGENVWDALCGHVESDDAEKYEYVLYFIVKYVDNIRYLHKDFMKFINSCNFLIENKLAERPIFLESKMETVIDKLQEFSCRRWGYYHPMCNTKLVEYKDKLYNDIISTTYGREYIDNHLIIKKNIMDGYDAGWLSPDGKFYGGNGPTSALIHLNLADKIIGGNGYDNDRKLDKDGWIKIHHDEIYGTFIGDYDEKKNDYKYCPTDIQIKMICDYVDKFYNGKFYAQPQIVEPTEPISTYKLRQMDRIMLHNVFHL